MKSKTIYVAADGKRFDDKAECVKYERREQLKEELKELFKDADCGYFNQGNVDQIIEIIIDDWDTLKQIVEG